MMRSLVDLRRDSSGTSAVEFALVSPVLIMLLMTFLGLGIYLNAANGLQQVAADAARTAVAGLNAAERTKLASDFVAKSSLNYFMIDKQKLQVTVKDDPQNPDQFTVSVEYDGQNLPIWSLYSFALPESHIRRFATIRLGGI